MGDFECVNAWLQDQLIPQLASVIGELPNKPECRLDRPRGTFFVSELFFASIRFNPGGREYHLLVKLAPLNADLHKHQNYRMLFSNETLAYQHLLPDRPEYPRCYLCTEDPKFGKVIVLENVCPRGYSVCPDNINLDLKYLVAALRSIGRFHGDTYALKERKPEEFRRIAGSIVKVRYSGDNDRYKKQINLCCHRLVQTLRTRTRDEDFVSRMEKLLGNCFDNVMMKCVEPHEPLATIVHGDCTANNFLYKRIEGSPADFEAMPVDFALIMYASPAIDVSTYLYMSASRQVIKERFEELFKAYHDSLTQRLQEYGLWNANKYSYAAFLRDYKRYGFFGYMIAILFLPIMNEYAKNNDLLQQLDDDLIQQLNFTGGGTALSNEIADMLIDFRDVGMFDDWLKK